MSSPLVSLPLYEDRRGWRVLPSEVVSIDPGRGFATVTTRTGERRMLSIDAAEAEARLWPAEDT